MNQIEQYFGDAIRQPICIVLGVNFDIKKMINSDEKFEFKYLAMQNFNSRTQKAFFLFT